MSRELMLKNITSHCLTLGVLALMAVILLGTGCASSTAKFTQQQFSTHIFANGNKQFSYQLAPDAQNAIPARPIPENKGPSTSLNGMPIRPQKKAETSPEYLENFGTGKLDIFLSESGYCRKGYLIIRRALQQDLIQLVGECREIATDDDRQRYPNSRSNIIRESSFPNFEPINATQ